MNHTEIVGLSKLISKVLRHKPEILGIEIDSEGWTDLEKLIEKINEKGWSFKVTLENIQEVVRENDKHRFSIKDGKIRANQGHTLGHVDIIFKQIEPPSFLFHGTARRFEASIMSQGLKPMKRQYVHLSYDIETARKVGARRDGNPLILKIEAGQASKDGVSFFISENGVYLVKYIDPKYITRLA